MKRIGKLAGLIGISFLIFFTACEEEENGAETEINGSITVSDQVISQNEIMVESATINVNSGWLVVHKNDNGSPMVPDIITEPVHIDEGTTEIVSLKIKSSASISDGEKIWVMLHKDTGNENEYEFGTDGDQDPAVTVDGSPVTTQITITAPKVMASDQTISNKTAVVDQVVAAVDGWLVIHKDDGSGLPGAVVAHTGIDAGTTENVSVSLADTMDYTDGMQLFPMLHIDNGTIGEYEFPDNDPSEIFGNTSPNIVLTSFTVESGGTSSDTVTINIENNTFDDGDKTISASTTVKWVNNDGYAHTVTSEDDIFDSGNISGGGTYSYTFDNTGAFPYVCTIHSGMSGTITVE